MGPWTLQSLYLGPWTLKVKKPEGTKVANPLARSPEHRGGSRVSIAFERGRKGNTSNSNSHSKDIIAIILVVIKLNSRNSNHSNKVPEPGTV